MAALPQTADELIERARADDTVRARLASSGALFGRYHPEMRALHEINADWLLARLHEGYWPDAARADETTAFWIIVQHAISRPALMRSVHELSEALADPVSRLRRAMLTDRIAVLEGRLQIYGTQIDWTADGELQPMPIGNPADVDVRRAAVGLGPLEHELVRLRARSAAEGERPPANWQAYDAERTFFAIDAGWRT